MTMTKLAFIALCDKHLIDPAIALENDNLAAALKNRDDAEVERIFREEF